MIIESNRLILESLSLDELQDYRTSETLIKETYNTVDFEMSNSQSKAIEIKIEKMLKINLAKHDWFTYWIIVNKENMNGMGLIGFKGLSDIGEAEIGYGIQSIYEGNGFMTEATKLLTNWAFEDKRCLAVTAKNVLLSNVGSQKILQKCGFVINNDNDETIDYILKRHSSIL